jgi:hypothetical protein
MSRDKRDVEAALLEKGFVEEESDHHFFLYRSFDGRKTRTRTKTSHTRKQRDLGDPILSAMARQCKLTKPQCLDLVDCPMGREQYEGILRGQGELPELPTPERPRRRVVRPPREGD